MEQTTRTEDVVRPERKAKRLADKLFFKLDRQGNLYSLRRTAGCALQTAWRRCGKVCYLLPTLSCLRSSTSQFSSHKSVFFLLFRRVVTAQQEVCSGLRKAIGRASLGG